MKWIDRGLWMRSHLVIFRVVNRLEIEKGSAAPPDEKIYTVNLGRKDLEQTMRMIIRTKKTGTKTTTYLRKVSAKLQRKSLWSKAVVIREEVGCKKSHLP